MRRLPNHIVLARLFPLTVEEVATLLEFEREGGILSEGEMIVAIRAMRGEALCSVKAFARLNPAPIGFVATTWLRKAERPAVVEVEPIVVEEMPAIQSRILFPPVSVMTLSPALEARFLAETTIKAKPEGKFTYACDTCGCEVKVGKQLNPSRGIYCPEHRFAAKAVTPCVIVEEAPVAPAPIAAQVIAEPSPVVEEVAATVAEPSLAFQVIDTFMEVRAQYEALNVYECFTDDNLGDIVDYLATQGIKFGLTPPTTVAGLKAKLESSPKWVAMNPEAIIRKFLESPVLQWGIEDTKPEPVVEAQAKKTDTVSEPIWNKLDNGRKVRVVVKLLEELGVVKFGYVKPTTAKDLKSQLRHALGNDWTMAIAVHAPKIAKALEN